MNPDDRMLVWAYSQMLKLYPARHRAEFGDEMRAVFEQEVDEAREQGSFAIARLVWRELYDAPGALIREHLEERGKQMPGMSGLPNRAVVPAPWGQVGLTVLPGMLFLIHQAFALQLISETLMHFLGLASLLFLLASSVWLVLNRHRPFPVPVWALLPLGFFGTFGLLSHFTPFSFHPACFLLVLLGIGAARANGASAALIVVIGGMILSGTATEPGMYLVPGPITRILLNDGVIVLFMILTPILVLRAHSVFTQGLAILLPLAAYCLAFMFALSPQSGLAQPMFHFYIEQILSITSPFLALFAITAMAAAIYAWIAVVPPPRHGTSPSH